MMTSVIAFIIVLGVLIFFHELGHFMFARLTGVGVKKFSIGFGPRVVGKKIGITDYCISAFPLGGFVKMVGEEPDEELSPDEIPISFTHKHVLKRILIVAAGPLFNYFLAVVIFFGLFQTYGKLVIRPVVGGVEEGTPAFKAGLKKDDIIKKINGMDVESWEDMADIIAEVQGKPVTLLVLRNDSLHVVEITPELKITKNLFGEDTKRYLIGITSAGSVFSKELNHAQAFTESLYQVYNISKLTVISIIKMIQGTISAKENLGGPIQIAQMAGKFYKEGVANFLSFIAFLSVTLAIINSLPIPVLDGGHILFFTIETIIRRPVNLKVREVAQQAGIAVLVLLMIFVFFNDVMKILVK